MPLSTKFPALTQWVTRK